MNLQKYSGQVVEIVERNMDSVRFCPQGGGFVRTATRADFDAHSEPYTVPGFFRATVSAEWFEDDFVAPCFSDGRSWNGWGMPYFEQSVLMGMMEQLRDFHISYDDARDCFCIAINGEEEIYSGMTIEVDSQPFKVYGVGAGSWCWDSCTPSRGDMPAAV
jgi:hypothetical protein